MRRPEASPELVQLTQPPLGSTTSQEHGLQVWGNLYRQQLSLVREVVGLGMAVLPGFDESFGETDDRTITAHWLGAARIDDSRVVHSQVVIKVDRSAETNTVHNYEFGVTKLDEAAATVLDNPPYTVLDQLQTAGLCSATVSVEFTVPVRDSSLQTAPRELPAQQPTGFGFSVREHREAPLYSEQLARIYGRVQKEYIDPEESLPENTVRPLRAYGIISGSALPDAFTISRSSSALIPKEDLPYGYDDTMVIYDSVHYDATPRHHRLGSLSYRMGQVIEKLTPGIRFLHRQD